MGPFWIVFGPGFMMETVAMFSDTGLVMEDDKPEKEDLRFSCTHHPVQREIAASEVDHATFVAGLDRGVLAHYSAYDLRDSRRLLGVRKRSGILVRLPKQQTEAR